MILIDKLLFLCYDVAIENKNDSQNKKVIGGNKYEEVCMPRLRICS